MTAGLRRAVFPSLILFVVVAASLFAAWLLVRHHRAETLHLQTGLVADQIAARLEEAIAGRLEMVEMLRREIAAGLVTNDRDAFEARAALVQQQLDGYQAINWIDTEGVIRWVVPVDENVAALDSNIRLHPDAGETFVRAEVTGNPQITGPVRLLQGGTGFAGYFPVDRDDGRQGYINAVFRIEDLARSVLGPAVLDHYAVGLTDDSVTLLSAGPPFVPQAEPFRSTSTLTVGERTWQLTLAPSHALMEATGRGHALLLAASLVLATALIGFAWLGLRSRLRLETSLQERDQAEAARASLSALVESSRDVVLMADRRLQLVYLNTAGRQLLGIDAPGDTNLRDLLAPDVLEEVVTQLDGGGQTGRWRGELALENQKDGEHIPLQLEAFPLRGADGTVTNVAAVGRDLRLQHHLEAQLAQAQKLEALGRLAGGVAHDFNNLIMVIQGNAELAARHAADAELVRDLEGILEASNRASTLTRQLLAFSRRRIAAPRPVDPGGVVRGVEVMLRRLIRENIALVVRTPSEVWPVVADPGELEQVVVNLAVNAGDAMPDGGRLAIEVENCAHPAGDLICVTVSDTGEGMSEEVRERLFEPFFTTKAVGRGTGLGLATVYAVVSRLRGRIFVESAPGEGSTFRIEIPRSNRSLDASAEEPKRLRRGNETILLVEDDADVRRVGVRLLEGLGHRVLQAGDGTEARALLESRKDEVDVVITDAVMPGLGGLELTEWIQAHRPELPIVATSGYSDALTDERGLKSRGVHFLPKPWTEASVSRVLREAMDGRAAVA
jgi:two-component system, cell cycle sensor histidine kinase and response regulator CckA